MVKKLIVFIFMCFLFSGCIQQDVHIILRADGSGEYHIKKTTSQIESAILANIPAELRDATLSEQMGTEEEYPGGLKRISYSVLPSPADSSKYIESSVYSFSNLGEALPALENVIDMGPRYAYRDGQFIVFLDREKQEYDGMNAEETMADAYLNVKIELPAAPLSLNGTVSGNSVSWKFNANDLKRFQSLPIGENLIQASIPSSAITVDLQPRLFIKKKKSIKKDKVFQPLKLFSATFPITGDMNQSEVKATLSLEFPIDEYTLPISYEDLHITSMVVDGVKVEANLTSETSGVFNGKDQWGQDVDGFPLNLEFPVSNPWVSTIDRIQVSLKVNTVEESRKTFYEVSASEWPNMIFPQSSNVLLDKVAIAKIEMGSSTAMWPTPSMTLLTTTEQSHISAIYIDTNYGLRYKADGIQSTRKKSAEYWDNKVKSFLSDIFMEEEFYEYELSFPKLPKTPFKLIIETIDEQNFESRLLTVEDIDVSP